MYNKKYYSLYLFAVVFTITLIAHGTGYAQSVGLAGETMDIDWPWTKFLNSIAAVVTGPIPMVIGIFGLVSAGIAAFMGHSGGASSKFILLVIVVSICFFAPTAINYISESAGGLTILEALNG